MTAHVRIADRPWADSIAVYLIIEAGNVRLIERPNHVNGPEARDPLSPGVDPGPSLTLSDDMARALLDALAAHYRRATDTGTLRADYEHERRRVDTLTNALVKAHADQLTAERTRIEQLAQEVGRR
jgi:hypothetical protein